VRIEVSPFRNRITRDHNRGRHLIARPVNGSPQSLSTGRAKKADLSRRVPQVKKTNMRGNNAGSENRGKVNGGPWLCSL
jgi:hypothetical protein